MKLKFKETCKDKHTGAYYNNGCTYEFEETRAKEILATGKAVEVKEQAPQKEPEPEQPEIIDDLEGALNDGKVVNLYDLSKDELVKLAKEVGVSIRGKKDDIIERILDATIDAEEVLKEVVQND